MDDHGHGHVAECHVAENITRVATVAKLVASNAEGLRLGQHLDVARSLGTG